MANPMRRAFRIAGSLALLARNHAYDLRRYFAYAASANFRLNDAQLQARLFQKAHSIEKGLSLPEIRPGFGVNALSELRLLMEEYRERKLDAGHASILKAENAIACYVDFHAAIGQPLPAGLSWLGEFRSPAFDSRSGGVQHLSREQVQLAAQGDFASLVSARRSIRTFSAAPVDGGLVDRAVGLALRSPSVCNRQSARTYHVTDAALISAIVDVQGGSRGFASEIGNVLIVTAHLGAFRGARERNQCWIDGGLFAMSLLYALSYVGLGSCPLNWSADARQDRRLRQLLDIRAEDSIIMLIAFGEMHDAFAVATSPRISVDECLTRLR